MIYNYIHLLSGHRSVELVALLCFFHNHFDPRAPPFDHV